MSLIFKSLKKKKFNNTNTLEKKITNKIFHKIAFSIEYNVKDNFQSRYQDHDINKLFREIF